MVSHWGSNVPPCPGNLVSASRRPKIWQVNAQSCDLLFRVAATGYCQVKLTQTSYLILCVFIWICKVFPEKKKLLWGVCIRSESLQGPFDKVILFVSELSAEYTQPFEYSWVNSNCTNMSSSLIKDLVELIWTIFACCPIFSHGSACITGSE